MIEGRSSASRWCVRSDEHSCGRSGERSYERSGRGGSGERFGGAAPIQHRFTNPESNMFYYASYCMFHFVLFSLDFLRILL